jgi:NADH-quinone oxidoreductase subunit M
MAHTMPTYCLIFLFFTLANIALPGTSSFVGEWLILLGVYQVNSFVAIMSATSMVLGGAYSLWLYNRVAYGNYNLPGTSSFSVDVSRREIMTFLPLIILTLLMGIYPEIFLDPLHAACGNLIFKMI